MRRTATEDTLTYTPSASTDDVVDAIAFDEDTSILTVSTTAGDDYMADLSDLSTGAFTDLSDTPIVPHRRPVREGQQQPAMRSYSARA